MKKMRFSQRKGYTPVSSIIQKDHMTDELRNSLWSVLILNVFNKEGFVSAIYGHVPEIYGFGQWIWLKYFERPVDEVPPTSELIFKAIRRYFFSCEWYEVYDFIESALEYLIIYELQNPINDVLEEQLSGYRFIAGKCTSITDDQEIEMLESAFADPDFPGVKSHLRRALELLSDREKPDYRNSIKESISAVESLAQSITDNPKSSLGDALKTLERSGKLHSALKEGFLKLYGYTSDEGGIRHAMIEEPNLTAADAQYFLLSCTSFINYLKSKI